MKLGARSRRARKPSLWCGKPSRLWSALTRVRLWDGSTPWLVTRHADQRTLLRDPRISSDNLRPGYPNTARIAAD
ncbi:MAG TPA: hypothetical protein VH478_07685, partial [Trebonia sp.]|nr:hypothetical protein [Trebonia sp.]